MFSGRLKHVKTPTEKHGENEFCVVCDKTLPYKWAETDINDPIRTKGGAFYTEGSGQTCAECAGKEKKK